MFKASPPPPPPLARMRSSVEAVVLGPRGGETQLQPWGLPCAARLPCPALSSIHRWHPGVDTCAAHLRGSGRSLAARFMLFFSGGRGGQRRAVGGCAFQGVRKTRNLGYIKRRNVGLDSFAGATPTLEAYNDLLLICCYVSGDRWGGPYELEPQSRVNCLTNLCVQYN